MKARPAGDCLQSLAGRNSLFSARENEPPLDVVYLAAGQVTTSCISGFEPAFEGFAVSAGDSGHFGQRYAFVDEFQRPLSFIGALCFVGYDFMLLYDASYCLATGFCFLGRGFDVFALVVYFEDLINKTLHDVGVLFWGWFS